MFIKMNAKAVEELEQSPAVAAELGKVAERVRGRVRAPSRMTVSARSGVGPRGAFAQVVMSGPGAIAVEYGSVNSPPQAPLRGAL